MNRLFARLGEHGPLRRRRRGVDARPLARKLTAALAPPPAAPGLR